VLGLGGCGLPPRASAPQLYDLGPPPAAIVPAAVQAAPMALALQVQAAPALQDAALHYRLAYADARQLHAYSQSRWAAPAADLLAQRLRLALAPQAALAAAEEAATQLLHVELLEFSQVYTAPQTSHALLRLRATLLQRGPGGWRLQAQREFAQQQTAARADAAAGVQALAAAADEAAVALAQWLRALR
jgi:cholesterol transport system auxiliary component